MTLLTGTSLHALVASQLHIIKWTSFCSP